MIYFLIGYMACGKSTIAKQLSDKYNIPHIDTDAVIEEAEGMSITEIFNTKGEDYFRQVETRVLNEIIYVNEPCIVSCGGGTPLYNNNIDLMNNNGISVYIKCSANTIVNRLSLSEIEKRPLLRNKTKIELPSIIDTEIKKREEIYNKANIIINYESINIKWPQS